MVLLENDTFLLELTKMFQKSRSTGTGALSITMKKHDGRERPVSSKEKPVEKTKVGKTQHPDHSCLMRAKLHNRKISTLVHSKDVTRFQLAYCNLLKGNMDALKKVKKTKNKSTKAT